MLVPPTPSLRLVAYFLQLYHFSKVEEVLKNDRMGKGKKETGISEKKSSHNSSSEMRGFKRKNGGEREKKIPNFSLKKTNKI